MVLFQVLFVGGVFGTLGFGVGEWELWHVAPGERVDPVTRGSKRVGVFAVADRFEDVASGPALLQGGQVRGVELEPNLIAGANEAELVVVGVEKRGDVSELGELPRHERQGGGVDIVVIVEERLLAVG